MNRDRFTDASEEYLVAYEHCYCLSPYQRELLAQRAVAVANAEDAPFVTIAHIERAARQLATESDADGEEFPDEEVDAPRFDGPSLEDVHPADREYASAYRDRFGTKVTATGIDWSERFCDEDYRYALTHDSSDCDW